MDLRRNEVRSRHEALNIQALSWSSDGRYLAAAGSGDDRDGGDEAYASWVHVFDPEKRRRILKLAHGVSRVPATAVAWSPDGRRLVSGDSNGLVEVWEVATGRRAWSRNLHTSAIRALAWSPDGRRVASGSRDGTVLLWDPSGGEELLMMDGPGSEVTQLVWSPNGRRLAGATADGLISIWDATVGYEFVQAAGYQCERVHEQLSRVAQHWAASRREEALALYEQSVKEIEEEPESLTPWVVQGLRSHARQAVAAGRYQEAITFFQMCLRLNKNDAGALESLARLRATCPDPVFRDPEQTIHLAQRAAALAPLWADVFSVLGAAYYRAGDYEAAIRVLEETETLSPGNNLDFNGLNLAMAYQQLGRSHEARIWYGRAVRRMDEPHPHDQWLDDIRAEAAELLGVQQADPDPG